MVDLGDAMDAPRTPVQLVLELDEFEGPMDVLLLLARQQRVDLKAISVRRLAEQYLNFIETAQQLDLELAGDYLVMASWLAYLKSRLLLPQLPEDEEGPPPEEEAAALAMRLRRLDAMQRVARRLDGRPRLYKDVFPRGQPDPLPVRLRVVAKASFSDLVGAYGRCRARQPVPYRPARTHELTSVEDALLHLERVLAEHEGWETLERLVPERETELARHSARAATLVAALELTRCGRARLRQARTFAPIEVRREQQAAALEGGEMQDA